MRVLTAGGLQRGEEYWPEVSPLGANVVERRRTRKRALESRDGDVNGEYSPAADGGQNGSPRESSTLTEANDEAVSE